MIIIIVMIIILMWNMCIINEMIICIMSNDNDNIVCVCV